MKTRILIVDDEDVTCHSLKTLLDSFGFETYFATCYDDAIPLVQQFRPEVYFLDWQLDDGHTGFELAVAVLDLVPDARIAIISGHDIEHVRKWMPAHLDIPLLAKPCRIEDLLNSVSLSFENQNSPNHSDP